ncbi:probable transcriptional regulatory protein Tlet_1011 isoform X2 [Anabrus simplex]|uniref:probable transcriptional regulatory protein Tlet_1011 isoform X2 n=1 Tax=Anabrus simplex TaxID=316456 RepID=UPI0034DD3E14
MNVFIVWQRVHENLLVMFPVARQLLFTCKLCSTSRRFAGHSKWANIKHIKAAKDGEKSQTFARMGRLIRVAVQEGGSADPNTNHKLAQAVEQAKKANMPAVAVQTILKQCKDPKTSTTVNLIGLKGPGGAAVLISLITNNFKLSKQNLAAIIKKSRFTFSDGTWDHLFSHKGIIEADVQKHFSSDDVLGHALEVGAEDVVPVNNNGEEYVQFTCEPKQLQGVRTKLEELGYVIRLAHCEYIPSIQITPNESDIESVQHLYRKLEGITDITGIYDNIAWNS